MRNKRTPHINIKPRYAFVVDGQTELWYLQMLKRNERTIGVDIRPELPQKKSLEEQYKRVIELSADYAKVFWIVDLDVILAESLTASKGQQKPIEIFLKYKADLEANNKNVTVIINQPCLEFWLLIHYEFTAKPFANCDEAGKQLKKYLTDYEKTENYFVKEGNDIYKRLKPKLSIAIANSKKFKGFDKTSPNNGLTEMHKLFEAIKIPSELPA